MEEIPVRKNEEKELPIPSEWRPVFRSIVSAFVKGDYALNAEIEKVLPPTIDTVSQIKDYIEDYGEELIELPEESWNTSIYMYHGNYWLVFIDLWTKREGRSDLVLRTEVRENGSAYEFEIKLVYVP